MTPSDPQLFTWQFESQSSLQAEYQGSLAKGRAFVPSGRALALRERCQLQLIRSDGEKLLLEAEVVWIPPDSDGVGLQLLVTEADTRLEHFAAAGLERPPSSESESAETKPIRIKNIYDRIRKLNAAEQQNVARTGTLAERIALERCYSGTVWEGILQNPQVSPNEVAKIAKKGSLPQPLLNLIVGNTAWLSLPEIQRALVSNPRLPVSALSRLLRAMPRRELAQLAQQSRLRPLVRAEAKRLLTGS